MSNDEQKCMFHFSRRLFQACNHYCQKAKTTKKLPDLVDTNISIIFISTSVLESLINEFISYSAHIDASGIDKRFCLFSKSIEKKLNVEEKWNIIASSLGGTYWNNSTSPFQNFNAITSLRNEITHYKGSFLKLGDAPTNKIKFIVDKFASQKLINSGYTWIYAILHSRELSQWIYKSTQEIYKSTPLLLNASKTEFFQYDEWEDEQKNN